MPRRKAVNEMKKLYEKNELLFAILWIVVYCAASIPIRGSLGDESLAMVIELAVIAAGILVFVKKFNLEEKYGLVKWNGSAANYLFFLPVLILMTGNLWGGVGVAYGGTAQVFAVLSHASGRVCRGIDFQRIFVPCPFEKRFRSRGDHDFGGDIWYRSSG